MKADVRERLVEQITAEENARPIRQPVVGFASLQLPLAEVFLWLMLLHALDSPGRRGLFISLLASIVLVAVAGVLSISMSIAPYIVLWAIAAITALVLGQRAELAVARFPVPAGGSVRRRAGAESAVHAGAGHHAAVDQ